MNFIKLNQFLSKFIIYSIFLPFRLVTLHWISHIVHLKYFNVYENRCSPSLKHRKTQITVECFYVVVQDCNFGGYEDFSHV